MNLYKTGIQKESKRGKHKPGAKRDENNDKQRKKADAAVAVAKSGQELRSMTVSNVQVGTPFSLPSRGFHASELASEQSSSLSSPATTENVLAAEAPVYRSNVATQIPMNKCYSSILRTLSHSCHRAHRYRFCCGSICPAWYIWMY
jgi:hypothetical protein